MTGDESAPSRNILRSFAQRVLSMARLTRILLVGIFSLAAALFVFPVVDHLYVALLFSPDTVILPSLITAAIGCVMYLVGWQLIVGIRGEKIVPSTMTVWYLTVGTFCIVADIALVIRGLTMLEAFASQGV